MRAASPREPSTLSPTKQALLEQRLKRASHLRRGGSEIPTRPDRDGAPMSFAQRQMWIIDRTTPGNPAYNVPVGYRIKGALDVAALEDAFNHVITRHEVLRTTFGVKDGDLRQIIHPALAITITVTALDHLPDTERENRLHALASEEAVRPFDLSCLPLLRVCLFTIGNDEHVVIINLHHIVVDGLSIGLLLDELDTFYRARTGGVEARPPDLEVQYGDYAQWQRQTLAGETAYDNQIEFWRKQLGGRLPVLELPGDMPRPALQSFKGSNVFFDIPASLVEELSLLGAREGCTFFMTVLAAFQVLLRRYSGADDVIIGTPIGARTARQLEPLIGNFLNMVALRCDLSGTPTFIDLLRRARETTLNAFSNSDLPFEATLTHLTFDRDPSRNPIFQVLLQVLPGTAPRLGDLDVSSFHFDLKFAQFDLSLLLYEDVGGYCGRFEYCTDLFHADTVTRLSANFVRLLHSIVGNPDQSIETLPILTDAERQRLLVEWNGTPAPPPDLCVHQLIERQAGRTPNHVALVAGPRTLTYGELNRRANQLAHRLRALGVGPDVLVGLFVDRSPEMLVGIVGILKAGGAYVPLDPGYPKERLKYILEDANVALVLTQQAQAGQLPCFAGPSICLDSDWAAIAARESVDDPVARARPEHLAYVLFTSGSTGRPKGVALEHRAATTFLQWATQVFTPQELAVVLFSTSICFDLSVFEIFATLSAGGTIVLAQNALDLPALAAKNEVTLINTVPSAMAELLRMGAIPASVKTVNLAGEALSDRLVEHIYATTNVEKVYNLYGPTEATTYSTYTLVPRNSPVTIGTPITGTQAYILDRLCNPVPIGVTGELYLAGGGLARGYYGRPELTAERFISNPFSEEGHSRMYRTGDLCRWLPDGNIQYLGRTDHQVKLRGFRIELGEIESTLDQHPAVGQSVVLVHGEEPDRQQLVAYVVPAPAAAAPQTAELRQYVRQRLPGFMVPAAVVVLEAFPLTPNGKIDRRALPSPSGAEQHERHEYVAPQDETERVLCRVWSEVLGVSRIGVDDDFFAIGGHSLLAAKLFARLDEEFGRSLPLGVLFAAPTVRALAGHYRAAPGPATTSALVALRAGGTLRPVFAVPGIYGNVVGFANLARELGSEQPFYGLQSVGLDGTAAPLDSIEAMARLYVTEVRSVQMRGPYAIVGACFGATVAYEMARQLLEAGEEVAFLGLLSPTDREGKAGHDTPAPAPRAYTRTMALVHLATSRLGLYLAEMQRLTPRERITYLVDKGRSLVASATGKNRFKAAQRELNQIEVYRANLSALDRYHRRSLDGRLRALEIFEPTQSIRTPHEHLDWSSLWTGATRFHYADGRNSGDMLSETNAGVIADLLVDRLRAAFDEEPVRVDRPRGASHDVRNTERTSSPGTGLGTAGAGRSHEAAPLRAQ